jgi:tetratricopeptide (TPR) repeat protein
MCLVISSIMAWQGRHQSALPVVQHGLDAIGEQTNSNRCRLLAAEAYHLSVVGDISGGSGKLSQARIMAEQLNDKNLLAGVILTQGIVCLDFMMTQDQVLLSQQAVSEARACGDCWLLADALWCAQTSLVFLGNLDEATRVGEELVPLAARLGNFGALLVTEYNNSFCDLMVTGNLERFEVAAKSAVDSWHRVSTSFQAVGYLHHGRVALWRGHWNQVIAVVEQGMRLMPRELLVGYFWGLLFEARAYSGNRNALQLLDQNRHHIPHPGEPASWGSWSLLLSAVEGLSVLGEREDAATLYPLVKEALSTGTIISNGLLQKTAGIAATAGERWHDAEQHFETALRQAHEIPHKIEQPEVRRWYARMLIERNAPGDHSRARQLLAEAIASYREIGMPKHVEMAQDLVRLLPSERRLDGKLIQLPK